MKRTTLFSRLGCLLLAALLLAGLAACAAKPEEKAMPSLPEMMKTITADVTVDTEESVIDSERFSSYFGIDPIDGFEAYASDAIHIRTTAPLWVHTDGEVTRKSDDFHVTCHKKALRLIL